MLGSLLSVTGLIIAGIVFVVLFVILSVSLWVSLVAAGGALVLWAAFGTGTAMTRRQSHSGG